MPLSNPPSPAAFIATVTETVTTTDATVTTLATIPISDDTVVYISADIVARRTDAADRAVYVVQAVVFREAAGGATLEGAVNTLFTRESAVPLDATIDVNGNNARIRITGQVGKTINWKSAYYKREVS